MDVVGPFFDFEKKFGYAKEKYKKSTIPPPGAETRGGGHTSTVKALAGKPQILDLWDIARSPKGKWVRKYLGRKEAERYLEICNDSTCHPIIKQIKKVRYFLEWAAKLLVPDFLIGYPNLFDNLKTLMKAPNFKPLRMALIAWLIFFLTTGSLWGLWVFTTRAAGQYKGNALARAVVATTNITITVSTSNSVNVETNKDWEISPGNSQIIYLNSSGSGLSLPGDGIDTCLLRILDDSGNIIETLNSACPFVSSYNVTNTTTQNAGTYEIYLEARDCTGTCSVVAYHINSRGTGPTAQDNWHKGALRVGMKVDSITHGGYPAGNTYAYGTTGDESVTLTVNHTTPRTTGNNEKVIIKTRRNDNLSLVETGATQAPGAGSTNQAFVIDNTYDAASTAYSVDIDIAGNSNLISAAWTHIATSSPVLATDSTSSTARQANLFSVDSSISIANMAPGQTVYNRGETSTHSFNIKNTRGENLTRAMTWDIRDSTKTTSTTASASGPTYSKSYTILSTDTATNTTTGDQWSVLTSKSDAHNTSTNIFSVSDLLRVSTLDTGTINHNSSSSPDNYSNFVTVFNRGETLYNQFYLYNVRGQLVTSSPNNTGLALTVKNSVGTDEEYRSVSTDSSGRVRWNHPIASTSTATTDTSGSPKNFTLTVNSNTLRQGSGGAVGSGDEWNVSELLRMDKDDNLAGGIDDDTRSFLFANCNTENTSKVYNRGESAYNQFYLYNVRGERINSGGANGSDILIQPRLSNGNTEGSAVTGISVRASDNSICWNYSIGITDTATSDTTGSPKQFSLSVNSNNLRKNADSTLYSGTEWNVSDLLRISTLSDGTINNNTQTFSNAGYTTAATVLNRGEAVYNQLYLYGVRGTVATSGNANGSSLTLQVRTSGNSNEGSANTVSADANGLVRWNYTPAASHTASSTAVGAPKNFTLTKNGNTLRQGADGTVGSGSEWNVSDLLKLSTNGSGAPNNGITTDHTVYNLGENVTSNFYLYNVRDEIRGAATDILTLKVLNSPNSAVEETISSEDLDAAGNVAWSYLIASTDAATSDSTGRQKQLNVVDSFNNAVTSSDEWGVSSLLTIDNIWHSKLTTDGSEATQFFIGADNMQVQTHVQDVRGNNKSGATVYQEVRDPDSTLNTSWSNTTQSSGSSTFQKVVPEAPAGTWSLKANAYDSNSNASATTTETISYVSAYTAKYGIRTVGWNQQYNKGNTATFTTELLLKDANDDWSSTNPDSGTTPYYEIKRWVSTSTSWVTVVARTNMTVKITSSTWESSFVIPNDDFQIGQKYSVTFNAKIGGAQIAQLKEFAVVRQTGGDPVSVAASPVRATANDTVRITIHESNLDGTQLTGNAGNTSVYIYNPSDSTVVNGVNPSELANGAYYYNYSLGASPANGVWQVVVISTLSGNNYSAATNFEVNYQTARETSIHTATSTIISAIYTASSSLGSKIDTKTTQIITEIQTASSSLSNKLDTIQNNQASASSTIGNKLNTIQTKTDTINWADITDLAASTTIMRSNLATLISEMGTGNITGIKTKTDTINWANITSILTDTGAIKAKTDTIAWGDVTGIKTKTDTILWTDVTGIKTKTDTISWSDITDLAASTTIVRTNLSQILTNQASASSTIGNKLNTIQTKTDTINWADITDLAASTTIMRSNLATLISEMGTGNITGIKTKTDTILWSDVTGLVTTAGLIKDKTDTIAWSNISAIKTKTDTISWSDITAIKAKTDTISWSDVTGLITSVSNLQTDVTTIKNDASYIRTKADSIYTLLSTVNTNLTSAQSTINSLRASQQKAYVGKLSNVSEVQTGTTYRAKLILTDFESEPVNATSTPTIAIYNSTRALTVATTTMTQLSTGVYEYSYTLSSTAATGIWESIVNFAAGSSATSTVNDYFQVTGSPAQVVINSMSDLSVPQVAANTTITNEGSGAFEYQYEWCVVTSQENQCGGNDDVYYASAAKLIQAGDSFTTNLTATVTQTGNYWFKVVVYYGTQASGASRTFTATTAAAESSSGGGGAGGGGAVAAVILATHENIYAEIVKVRKMLESESVRTGRVLDILGIINPDVKQLLAMNETELLDIKSLQNKIADIRAVSSATRRIVEEKTAAPVIETYFKFNSVEMHFLITNPANARQTVKFKSFLPQEARPEHIIDASGLKVDYDAAAGAYFVAGDIVLGPKQTVTKKVEMKDIWVFPEEETASLMRQGADLADILKNTQYDAQGLMLKNDINALLEAALAKQKEGYSSPQDHIVAYRENKLRMARVEKNIEKLKDLIVQASASRSVVGKVGGIQTFATWGIVLALVFGFGLLAAIIFAMWRHQMALAAITMGMSKKEAAKKFGGFSGGKNKINKNMKIKKNSMFANATKKLLAAIDSAASAMRRLPWKKILTVSAITLAAAGLVFGGINFLPSLLGAKNEPPISDLAPEETEPAPEENTAGESAPVKTTETTEAQNDNVLKFEINTPASTGPKLRILDTPIGWLNVRDKASREGKVIAQIYPGEEYEYLSEESEWYEIKILGESGWISKQYAEKIQ